jgi:hypothetical protein
VLEKSNGRVVEFDEPLPLLKGVESANYPPGISVPVLDCEVVF